MLSLKELNDLCIEKPELNLELSMITKNNCTLHGVIFGKGNVKKTIYLENYETTDALMKDIKKYNNENIPKQIKGFFDENGNIKIEKVQLRVINENNKEMIRKFEGERLYNTDLFVIHAVIFDDGNGNLFSANIPKSKLKEKDFDIIDDYTCTDIVDTIKNGFSNIDGIDEILPDVEEIKSSIPMYVLSNYYKIQGSGVLAHKEFLDKTKEKIGEFYILPSSVHQVIAVPISDNTPKPDELRNIVNEINPTISSVDVLSDKVYLYDGNEIKIVD